MNLSDFLRSKVFEKKLQLFAELEMTKNVRKKMHRAAYYECMNAKVV